MQAVIFAGGYGTRLGEETQTIPKPMVEIGGKPIIWHIMKIYSHYGIHDFVILLGYKGYVIKEYFANYFLHQSDLTIDLKSNSIEVHNNTSEPWRVTLLDTGQETQTGGRLRQAKAYLQDEPFMLTYGDGVADIDIAALQRYHREQNKILTMTVVRPEGRYGVVDLERESNDINRFLEKPTQGEQWINGGFMVCQPEIFEYLQIGDEMPFEWAPLEKLASSSQVKGFRHEGFWRCMDTVRDKNVLEQLWQGDAPWKVWE